MDEQFWSTFIGEFADNPPETATEDQWCITKDSADGVLSVTALAEGGYYQTDVELQQILEWAAKNQPEMVKDALYAADDDYVVYRKSDIDPPRDRD